MSTADGREIYVIGTIEDNNREMIIQEDESTHDLPAEAKYTYSDAVTKFPYTE